MIRRTVAAAAFVLAATTTAPAAAGCTARDRWTGPDKNLHLAAGALVGMAATLQTGNRWAGFSVGLAVGAAKELDDLQGGTCSLQDFAVTALGAALGAQLGGVMVWHARGRTSIAWSTDF